MVWALITSIWLISLTSRPPQNASVRITGR